MSGISHNDVDALCAMAREARGERLNDIRLALNELMQADHAAWVSGTRTSVSL